MLARNFLAVAAAGGLALGTLTGMAWHPRMTMVPVRPWQGNGRTPDLRDFQPASAWRDSLPVATLDSAQNAYQPPAYQPAIYQPMPRIALADDYVPQRPILGEEHQPTARRAARQSVADEATIAGQDDGPPPLDELIDSPGDDQPPQ